MNGGETNLLRRFIATAPVGLLMLDQKLCNLQASRHWIAAWSGNQFEIGMHHYEACPFVLSHWKEANATALADGIVIRGVDRFLMNDQEYWAAWEVMPWGSVGKKPRGIIIYAENLTLRQRSAQALHDSGNDLHSLLSHYRENVCSCRGGSVHAPTCWAYPTAPVIVRAEEALRGIGRVEERLRIRQDKTKA